MISDPPDRESPAARVREDAPGDAPAVARDRVRCELGEEDEVYREILYRVEDPTATLTLNRPDRLNAWTDRMGIEVKHALAQAEDDSRVVAVILTGAGRGFCAGADMQRLKDLTRGMAQGEGAGELAADPGDAEIQGGFREAYTYMMSLRKPIIAAINGPCAGMALPIALSCDIRFASDRAVFTTAFSRRGLVAEWGIAWLLPRLVGSAHALDLLFTGRRVGADEAAQMGLVNRVVPHEDLLKQVREYAREMAENCSPTSMRVMKRQVYEALHEPLSEAHEKSVQLMHESLVREDFAEGVDSFLEKRPPKFRRI
jgi:enoyl-CoA hydratase/carnithine racemase